jgi:hypothetical protein
VRFAALEVLRANERVSRLDGLLFATVFTITFAKIRWNAGGADVNISDFLAGVYVVSFVGSRVERGTWRAPRTAAVVAAFFLAFALVYLIGFFNIQSTVDLSLFEKGLAKFTVHFLFLLCAVVHLADRGPDLYWRTFGWFVAGIAANCVYGILQLGVAEATRENLDEILLSPIGSYQRGGINIFGAVGGAKIYRINALTLDPNHLGVMLIVPILTLLPIYLRLEQGHRLRKTLAGLLVFFCLVELATLSRSGFLGIAVGLIVLALPYRGFATSRRLLVPLGVFVGVVGILVATRFHFFERVWQVRTRLSGSSVHVHFAIYDLVPPVLHTNPLFGLGLNTFSAYYEFVTGKQNWGPHSYYIAVIAETGFIGAGLFLLWVGYLFIRLGALRELGRSLARAGDALAARVRPLGWGLTAALAGTLAANVFYLTMQMYYFFVLALLVVAAPLVFARGRFAIAPA